MYKRIFDFHAHAFPEKVEERAIAQLQGHYGLKISQRGCMKDLIESADTAGVERLVIHATATVPEQVEVINDWIAMQMSERVIGFGTLHPDYTRPEKELRRMQGLGLRGLKLHPDFQGFDIDDQRMWRIYHLLDRKFPVLFHLGDERLDHSSPIRLARVLDRFPQLKVVGAHLGGYARWQEMKDHLMGRDLYFDTSSTLWRMDPLEAVEIIRNHGVEKILFGTDYPITSHREELERFFQLPLTEAEQHLILWENAQRLFQA